MTGPIEAATPTVFLTTPEAAELLRLSTVTLSRWRIEGLGPQYHLFGRRVVYAEADILKWAARQKRQSTSAPGSC
jgi:predicted DNA-binding transcriptional regulator AlpA